MRSIRSKITMLSVIAIIVAMSISTILAVSSISDFGDNASNQILRLLCETGQKNLDTYFERVEQSVEIVSSYAEDDLAKTDLSELDQHLERVKDIFEKTANKTDGVLTYYYRIDPEISTKDKGFWFINLDKSGFVEHEVTDITLYDTSDQSALVWFTVPKANGTSIWLPPYVTDNLDVYVLSYNVPIYKNNTFIGVIGIEIDYSTMAEAVDNITLYDNGYAFINDDEGTIIYHPQIATAELIAGYHPQVPDGLLSESTYIRYTYEGSEKIAVWLKLRNGMRLNVTVPVAEINHYSRTLMIEYIIAALVLLALFIILTMQLSKRISEPLIELSQAAKRVDEGDYNFKSDYQSDDEVGALTQSFANLVDHLKVYISDLNSLAYADALTKVHNKGAFDIYIRKMEDSLQSGEASAFAIGFFDCDKLKKINDEFGHDKGDIYLQNACSLICNIFKRSPVFRIGGDEFALILQDDDFENREELIKTYLDKTKQINQNVTERYEMISTSFGIAEYDPKIDKSVNDVIRRADALMYENKRQKKVIS